VQVEVDGEEAWHLTQLLNRFLEVLFFEVVAVHVQALHFAEDLGEHLWDPGKFIVLERDFLQVFELPEQRPQV